MPPVRSPSPIRRQGIAVGVKYECWEAGLGPGQRVRTTSGIDRIGMTPVIRSRRSFLRTTVALAGTAPLVAGPPRARADGGGGPLIAYVGTFSSPLHDVPPTQVD